MERVTTIADVRRHVALARRAGKTIALVPTMGALHEGHLRLVDAARTEADLVVMSVFVNPLQFRPGEDFERYPRPLERDAALAEARGVSLLFTPEVADMYGAGDEIRVVPGDTAARWEGEFRPGHFEGVLTVVAKLFHIVQPDVALFGQKDIQQATLIRRMVEELDFPLRVVVVPTMRDGDGLALSSRNAYLSPDERAVALAIPRALQAMAAAWEAGTTDAATLRGTGEAVLAASGSIVVDYIAVADPERLAPVETAASGTVIAIAARVGATRLIDNVLLGNGIG